MVRLFLSFLHHEVVVLPLVVWMAWIWDSMVIPSVRAITLIWTTSLLVWNVIRCFVIEIFFVPMKHVHTMSSMGFKIKGIGRDTQWSHSSRILDETYTCIFCKNLAFCEFRCNACIFIVISHLPSPRYICLAMHVGLHNHFSTKERIKRLWIGWTKQ